MDVQHLLTISCIVTKALESSFNSIEISWGNGTLSLFDKSVNGNVTFACINDASLYQRIANYNSFISL